RRAAAGRRAGGARTGRAGRRGSRGGSAMTAFLIEPAPRALSGRVTVPGDKSIGHRALLLSALCDGEVEVTGLSGGQDNRRTRTAMEAMGARAEDLGAG